MSDAGPGIRADVVVAGAGAAGLAAAIEAARAGASVVVVDKQPRETAGGNTVVSGGIWFHHDDVPAAARYLRALSGTDEPRPDVVETWARETAHNSEWMRSLGADVRRLAMHEDPEFPELDGSDCYQGYWSVDGVFGEGHLFSFLLAVAEQLRVDLRWGHPVSELRMEDGDVVGVVADGLSEVRASRGVVLATGGFAGNGDLVARHLELPEASPWGSPHCTGDGLALAAEVGAATRSLGNHMRLLGAPVPGQDAGVALHVPPGCGFAFVDDDGQRFVDEAARNCHGHVRRGDRYERFPAGPFWLLVDRRALEGGPLAAPAPFGWANRMGGHRWSADNQAEVAAGLVRVGSTIEELADVIGCSPETLSATVLAYNASAGGAVDPFGRSAATMVPLDLSPYAAVRCSPLVAFTGGGPVRDGRARVLRDDGTPVSRLFAAGELSATYTRCMDGGMMIADALAFGRVAGQAAAGSTPVR